MRKILLTITLALLVASCIAVASACPTTPAITLSSNQGYSSIVTVGGTNFEGYAQIALSWDGTQQLTIPSTIITDYKGSFVAFISTPSLPAGIHTITAADNHGNTASTTFTVIDAKGEKGDTGATGAQGIQGIQGVAGQNGADGKDGLDFNATGDIFVYNGTNGIDGKDGINGVNGINGTNGTNGLNGKNGIDGISIQGTRGDKGDKGDTGATGATGADGKDGENGKDGIDGQTIIQSAFTGQDTSFLALMMALGCVLATVVFCIGVVIVMRKK